MKTAYLKNPRVLAGAAVVFGLVLVGLWPETIAADLATVQKGPLRVTVDEEGETRVRDRFVVSAPFTGRILRIELEPGEPVRAGDVLAVLRPADVNLLDVRSRAASEAPKARLGNFPRMPR